MQRHPTDVFSLVAGLAFLALGLRLLGGPIHLASLRLDWLGPVALIAVGVALVASLLRSRSRPE